MHLNKTERKMKLELLTNYNLLDVCIVSLNLLLLYLLYYYIPKTHLICLNCVCYTSFLL